MKKLKDERIRKDFDKLASKMYWFVIAVLVGLLFYKLFNHMEIITYGLELLCFVITIPYLVVNLAANQLLFSRKLDDSMCEIKNKIYSRCFMICFWIIIIGEGLLIFLIPDQILVVAYYLATWMIPALIITAYSIKKGLLIWGGEKRKEVGIKAFKKRVAIGALFCGIIMGAPMAFKDGTFHALGLLWILGMALGWGIPFYLIFSAMMKKSEKNANKQLKLAGSEEDDSYEEQENENSQN